MKIFKMDLKTKDKYENHIKITHNMNCAFRF